MPDKNSDASREGLEFRVNGWRAPVITVAFSVCCAVISGVAFASKWQGQTEMRVEQIGKDVDNILRQFDQIVQLNIKVASLDGQLESLRGWRTEMITALGAQLTLVQELQRQVASGASQAALNAQRAEVNTQRLSDEGENRRGPRK